MNSNDNDVMQYIWATEAFKNRNQPMSANLKRINRAVEVLAWSNEDIVNSLADAWCKTAETLEAMRTLIDKVHDYQRTNGIFSEGLSNNSESGKIEMLGLLAENEESSATVILKGIQLHTKSRAKLNGENGAKAHREPWKRLQEWTIEQYLILMSEWADNPDRSASDKRPPANSLAKDLEDRVIAHGKALRPKEVTLTANARRTITGWINDYRAGR